MTWKTRKKDRKKKEALISPESHDTRYLLKLRMMIGRY